MPVFTNPRRMPCFGKTLVNPCLIGAERAAALQQQYLVIEPILR